MWIRFIELIKNVLRASKVELKRLENLLWGRGTSISGVGVLVFLGEGY